MDQSEKQRAEDLTEKALAEGPFADFRDAYRGRLRWLKDNQPQSFPAALEHYNEILVPNIANGTEPLREWIEFGKRLAELSGRGRLIRVDGAGRALDFEGVLNGLLLHLPDDTAVPALALAVPRELSDAQQATVDLLIRK